MRVRSPAAAAHQSRVHAAGELRVVVAELELHLLLVVACEGQRQSWFAHPTVCTSSSETQMWTVCINFANWQTLKECSACMHFLHGECCARSDRTALHQAKATVACRAVARESWRAAGCDQGDVGEDQLREAAPDVPRGW